MRIRYVVPFKRPIIIDDHWEIPIQGGKLRVAEQDGYAKALELTLISNHSNMRPISNSTPRAKPSRR